MLLAILPAAILAVVAASALGGDSGVLARYELRGRVQAANAELAELERDNRRLVREIAVLGRDRRAVERAVAEEIGRVATGTTVYRFDDAD